MFWILWWLLWILIALQGIEHAPANPASFIQGLVVAVIFGQALALLIALAWYREPGQLVDLISQQLSAGNGGVRGSPMRTK